eukprot:3771959-Rhodomonas_salina.1
MPGGVYPGRGGREVGGVYPTGMPGGVYPGRGGRWFGAGGAGARGTGGGLGGACRVTCNSVSVIPVVTRDQRLPVQHFNFLLVD